MSGVIRWLGGELRVRAAYRNPERVLNLCAEAGIPFREVRRASPETVDLSLSRRDWTRFRMAVQRRLPDCGLSVLARTGAPFLLSRFRRRPALAVTLTVSAFALFLASFFIWDFDVEGNRTVPREAILRALERQGVGIGTFGLALNGQDLRNHILLDLPELAWMTVNVSGCRAKVQVVERVEPPEILNEAQPVNLAARRAGLVLEVRALDGKARVVRGMAVDEGDLLVSGTEELGTLTGGARTMAAHGSVTARTWHSLTASVPLSGTEKRETGETLTGLSLVIGRRRFPLYRTRRLTAGAVQDPGTASESGGASASGGTTESNGTAASSGTAKSNGTAASGGTIESGGTAGQRRYDKRTERSRWTLLGVALPVTLVRETYRFYELEPVERTEAEAKARGEAALRSCLDAETAPYGTVRSALCTARRQGDTLAVTLTAECVEEIGTPVPLSGEDGE